MNRTKLKSAGAARIPTLGIAMFAPSVLYIALLIGVPFVLAVLYAFSDARIGSMGFHYVGLENFRSILHSPSFRKAPPFTINRNKQYCQNQWHCNRSRCYGLQCNGCDHRIGYVRDKSVCGAQRRSFLF